MLYQTLSRRCLALAAGAMLAALATSGVANAQAAGAPPPQFGSPPSGEVPIIFNPLNLHVYSRPDKLRSGRVLAALIKGQTILVPLRSLFEQMGASVSYEKSTKTVDVSKPGADVKVTVGKHSVEINGETRPLDIPPEIYKGVVLVPLRVISESMGAYVVWIPEKRLVVVRYLEAPPPTPVPTPLPTAPPTIAPTPPSTPTPTPTPTPVPAPTVQPFEKFVAGDYDINPSIFNELTPGNPSSSGNFDAKAGFEFPLIGQRWLLEGNYQRIQFPHNSYGGVAGCAIGTPGCSTVVGSDPSYQPGLCPSADPGCVTVVGYQNLLGFNGLSQGYAPGFTAHEDDFQGKFALKIADPRIYIGVGAYVKHFDYLAYPTLVGFGGGLEKLPDFDQPFSVFGDVWYYPSISGNYNYPTSAFLGPLSGQQIKLSYSALLYHVGATIDLGKSPFFIQGGYAGQKLTGKTNAPSDRTVSTPFVGLGAHF